MSVGAHPGETDIDRGSGDRGRLPRHRRGDSADRRGRRALGWLDLRSGSTPGRTDQLISLALFVAQAGVVSRDRRAILFVGLVEILAATVVSGGPVPSQMVILWGVVIVRRGVDRSQRQGGLPLVLGLRPHPRPGRRVAGRSRTLGDGRGISCRDRLHRHGRHVVRLRRHGLLRPQTSTGSSRSRTISCTTSSPDRSPRVLELGQDDDRRRLRARPRSCSPNSAR